MTPFAVGDVVTTAVRIWVRNLPRLLAIVVVFQLVAVAWGLLQYIDGVRAVLAQTYALMNELPLLAKFLSSRWIVEAFTGAALTFGTLAVLRGGRLRIGASCGGALRRGLPVIGVAFVVRLATWGLATVVALAFGERYMGWDRTLTLLLLLLAPVVVGALFVVVAPTVIAERRGVFAALRRGFVLAHGQRLRVFAIVLAMSLLGVGLYMLTRAIFVGEPTEDLDGYFARLVRYGYISFGLELVLRSLFGVIVAVTYERLRESKEGPRPAELDQIFD